MKARWEPEQYHKDPMINAVLNVAASVSELAEATDGIIYGLKYSKKEGMSIAEAIECHTKAIQENASIADHSQGLRDIAEAIEKLGESK